MVNHVFLIGHLGQDPELRQTNGAVAVCNFTLATSEKYTDKSGDKHERTEWHRIVCWDKLAEICGEHLAKGRQVCVQGKLQTRKWEDKDGTTRYTTEVIARDVTFLGKRETESAPERPTAVKSKEPEPDDLPF